MGVMDAESSDDVRDDLIGISGRPLMSLMKCCSVTALLPCSTHMKLSML